MNQAERLLHALAQGDESELSAACEAASQTLNRCVSWRASGAIWEAAGLNLDAGNIIGLAVRLSRLPNGPPAQLQLPSHDALEAISRLPADALSHRELVEQWIELNLRGASLTDRIASSRKLRLSEPNNPAWRLNHDELESVVVRLWDEESDRCIAEGNSIAIARLSEQINAMGFLSRSGQRLLHKLDIEQTEQAAIAAAKELGVLEMQLHLAWAAMDLQRARRLRANWRRVAEVALGNHEHEVHSVFRWIAEEDRREDAECDIQARIDDLVRALDELKPVRSIERRYSSLRNDEAIIPSAVESRVTHYVAQERKKRTRRFVVVLSSIIAIASVLVGLILINHYSTTRQNLIESLSRCIKQNLDAGDILAAQDCWSQAMKEGLGQSPLIAAHRAGIDRGRITLEERRKQAELDVAAAVSLLESNDASLAQIEEATALLRGAEPVARVELLAKLKSQLRRAATLHSARITEARAERLAEFAAIERLLEASQPAIDDFSGWKSREEALQRAEHMLLQLRKRPAAEETDLRARADVLESRIDRLWKVAKKRTGSIHEANRLMSELHRIPSGGCNWYNIWDDLLSHHADELIALNSSAKWAEGRSRAQAACATENWRKVVLPELRMHGILGTTTDTPNPRSAVRTLKSHLESFPDNQSPYADAAKRLIEYAGHFKDIGGQGVLRRKLESTGFLELYVADTELGYRYLRPFEGGLRRIDSRQDLSTDPQMLKELTNSEKADLWSSEHPAAIASALQGAIDAYEANSTVTVDAVCDFLEAVQDCPEPDAMLHFAVLQTLWELILELNLPLPKQTRDDAAEWLDALRTSAPDAHHADWAQRAPTANSSTQIHPRRHATSVRAKSPRHYDIRALHAGDQGLEEIQSMAAARLVQGLLVPDPASPSGMMRAQLLESDLQRPEVLLRQGNRWYFFQFDDHLSHDDLVEAPQGISTLPVIIFGKP